MEKVIKFAKGHLIWVISGAVVVIVAIIGWWMWYSYVPYDVNDPEVQAKLAQIEEYRQEIEEGNRIVNSYIEIGHIYEQLSDDRRALATYKKLARLRPKSSPPFIAMAQYYRDSDKPDLAEKYLLKAANNDPDNVSIYQDLSFVYIYYPELDDGQQFEALALDAINNYQSIKSNLTQILAFYCKETGKTDKAIEYLTQLKELAPDRISDWQSELDELTQ